VGGLLDLATDSPEQTKALGRALSGVLAPGDVVSLTGDLGAGKTTLIQGAAEGLGVSEPVLSPTFTLVREYVGDQRVYHLDVYRLDRLHEVLDLGFEEILDRGGVVFVEWGDAIQALLPDAYLQIELLVNEADDRRLVFISWQGRPWVERWERLAELIEPWRASA
jgi:tRNA threonylcarbamoyladenosine biosynthesis protein TsaE